MSNSSIWPIDWALSGATTSGQSGPRSNGNEGVLFISQSSSITWASPSDCLVSYLGHSLGKSYPSAEIHLVYSTPPSWLGHLSLVCSSIHFDLSLSQTFSALDRYFLGFFFSDFINFCVSEPYFVLYNDCIHIHIYVNKPLNLTIYGFQQNKSPGFKSAIIQMWGMSFIAAVWNGNRELLEEILSGCLISLGCDIPWPVSLLNLYSCGYLLWRYLKV